MANPLLLLIKAVLDNQTPKGFTQINKDLEKTGAKITSIKISKDLATGAEILNANLKPIGDSAGNAAAKMGDFQKALNRVAIVAPVWMAFRTVMMGFFSGISEGFKLMEDFDRSMLKAKAVITGASRDIGASTEILSQRIRSLSQATGESMADIAEAFYRFGEIGTPFEESWAGAEASVRYARATMGDAVETASTMALVMRLLGKTTDETIPANQKLEIQMAKMYKLWQVNAFEANELTASFKAFLPTANTMGFSLDQTSALLATLGSAALQGSRGGTLMRTSMTKLVQNLPKLATTLGMYVNPELETTFDVLMRVLGKIKELQVAGGISIGAENVLTDIFGGVRGAEPIRALVATYDLLNDNLGVTTKKYNELGEVITNYKDRQEDVTNSLFTQMKINRQLQTQTFEAFLSAVVGGKDYIETIKIINNLLLNMITSYQMMGRFISQGDEKEAFEGIKRVIQGKSSLAEIIELISQIESRSNTAGKAFGDWIPRLKAIAIEMGKTASANREATLSVSESAKAYMERSDAAKVLLTQIDLQNQKEAETLDIIKLQNLGYSESQIAVAKFSRTISSMVDTYNSLDSVQKGIEAPIDKQNILTLALQGNWQEILDLTKQNVFVNDTLLKLNTELNKLSDSQVKSAEQLITAELEMLKLRGASSAEILKAEKAMKSVLYGEDAVNKSRALGIKQEQEITKQKLMQTKLSSDSVKLYRIAQTEGVEAAKLLAGFLKGDIDLSKLREMPRIFELAKKEFADMVEQEQAKEFFGIGRKSLGGGQYRGATGSEISIPELTQFNPAEFLAKLQQLAVANIPSIAQTNNIPVKIEIQNINMKADIDKLIEEIKQRIMIELDNQEAPISQKIQEKIQGF